MTIGDSLQSVSDTMTVYGKSEDFVILAVPDCLPVLEPDSLAPPTFVLVGMTVLVIDVPGERRDCVRYKNCSVRTKLLADIL